MPASAEAAPEAAATCPLCGYDLRGQRDQPEPRCPECGRRFDWADFADPARRRHPSLFEHHPERPVGSYFRTLIGGLRPRRFWGSINPAGPSKPRRFVAYWLVGATLWTAVALVGPMAAAVAEQVQSNRQYRASPGPVATANLFQSLSPEGKRSFIRNNGTPQAWLDQNHPMFATWQMLRDTVLYRDPNPVAWRSPSGFEFSNRQCLNEFAAVWLIALLWPVLSPATLLGLRTTRRQAKIRTASVMRAAAYSGDLLIWMSATLGFALASAAYVRLFAVRPPFFVATGFAGSLPDVVAVFSWIPAALGVCWLLFAYRLYAAHRHYLRLPHAAGVVIATQVVLLLILANLYVLTLI